MGGMKGMAPGPKAEDLPLAPSQNSGSSVTGAFEGWFPNPDGSFSLLVGYYNRNLKEAVDVPIGPDNDIEPGGPDQGQPTHFLPGRAWGMFTIKVPKDFGTNKVAHLDHYSQWRENANSSGYQDALGDRPV